MCRCGGTIKMGLIISLRHEWIVLRLNFLAVKMLSHFSLDSATTLSTSIMMTWIIWCVFKIIKKKITNQTRSSDRKRSNERKQHCVWTTNLSVNFILSHICLLYALFYAASYSSISFFASIITIWKQAFNINYSVIIHNLIIIYNTLTTLRGPFQNDKLSFYWVINMKLCSSNEKNWSILLSFSVASATPGHKLTDEILKNERRKRQTKEPKKIKKETEAPWMFVLR